MMQLVDEIDDVNSHPVGGLVFVALGESALFLFGPGQQFVQVCAEALYLAECAGCDVADVGFGEPGEEGADAGVEGNTGMVTQVILAVVQGQPAVAVVGGRSSARCILPSFFS